MRTVQDLSPLFRSSIGFDRLFNLLERANGLGVAADWPPYDIVKLGDDDYRITLAVAGFQPEELGVSQEGNVLVVSGSRKAADRTETLYRGLPEGSFRHRFELADYVKVASASLENGLLVIDLKRELPEAMKPRRIAISSGTSAAVPQIEAGRQAAA